MPKRKPARVPGLFVMNDQRLVGVLLEDNGREVAHYFVEGGLADRVLAQQTIMDALNLAGAWSDLDWEHLEKGLDRIRRESPPSPPISL